MGLHAAIIRLGPLIHDGEQRYKPYIVGDPRMVSLSVTPPLKNPGYAPAYKEQTQKDLQDKIALVVEELRHRHRLKALFFSLNGVLGKWEMFP